MKFFKKITPIIGFFTIIWYIYLIPFFNIKSIYNIYIKWLFFVLPATLYLFFVIGSYYVTNKYNKNKLTENKESYIIIIIDLINIFSFCINIYAIIVFISVVFFNTYSDNIIKNVSSIIMLVIYLCIIYLLVKKIIKTTFSKFLILIFIVYFIGWFSFQDITLVTIFSIILNIIVSINDRKKLIKFLKRKNIGNEKFWCQNDVEKLTDEEMDGKFIAQKILIYILTLFFYITIKITEDINFSLNLYSILNSEQINSYPDFTKYLFKGLDRIVIFTAMFYILYKSSKDILKKIF